MSTLLLLRALPAFISAGSRACLWLLGLALIVPITSVSTAQTKRVGWFQKDVAPATARPLTIAVLEFGDSSFGRLAPEKLRSDLESEPGLIILDRDQVHAAARGVGY